VGESQTAHVKMSLFTSSLWGGEAVTTGNLKSKMLVVTAFVIGKGKKPVFTDLA
jgi:hypothetical protein